MTIAAWQGFCLVEMVLNDVAALAAHRFVAGRQLQSLAAVVHRFDQQRAVNEIDRRARGVMLGGGRELAGRHIDAACCAGAHDSIVQAAKRGGH